MLQDLKTKVPAETVRALHDLAVKFYSDKGNVVSRAEEIYHRLCRGDDPEQVASRWMEGVEPRLRNALEELPVDARIWLSGKLGVTPDSSLLKKAGLEKWEEITARTAQRFLSNGHADKALELMRERAERSPVSPLYRLELEALRLLGLYEEALFIVNEALASLPGSASTEFAHILLLQATLVNEALNKIDEAIEYIKESEKLLTDPVGDIIEAIRVFITHIRLLRKKGPSKDTERGVLIKKVMRMVVEDGDKMDDTQIDELIEKRIRFQLNAAVIKSLRSSPALLQELIAELGKVVSQLILYALDYIGIDLRNDSQKNMLAKAFKDWNDQLSSFSNSGLGELVERSGINNNSVDSWLSYINRNTGRTLGSAIYNWQYEIRAHEAKSQSAHDFDKVLVDISRNNVEMSINKSVY
jgi:tetratricopeptide (TPR) repeat protein